MDQFEDPNLNWSFSSPNNNIQNENEFTNDLSNERIDECINEFDSHIHHTLFCIVHLHITQQHVDLRDEFTVIQQQQFDVFEEAHQSQANVVVVKNDVFLYQPYNCINSSNHIIQNHMAKTKTNQVVMEDVAAKVSQEPKKGEMKENNKEKRKPGRPPYPTKEIRDKIRREKNRVCAKRLRDKKKQLKLEEKMKRMMQNKPIYIVATLAQHPYPT